MALLSGHATLAIAGAIPAGFSGNPLVRLRLVLAASPRHPLHHLKRKPTLQDLQVHRQLIVRETGQNCGTRTTVEATLAVDGQQYVNVDHRRARRLWLCVVSRI